MLHLAAFLADKKVHLNVPQASVFLFHLARLRDCSSIDGMIITKLPTKTAPGPEVRQEVRSGETAWLMWRTSEASLRLVGLSEASCCQPL